MAWVNEDDELYHTQLQLVKTKFESFLKECRAERQCGTCNTIYRPLLSMGKFECRVHPENLLHGPPLSSTLSDRGIGGSNSLANHYPCCGTVHADESEKNVLYGGWISRAGCCRADHVASMRWRAIGDVETPVFDAVFNRMRIASSRILYDNEAASLRLHILPIPVIVGIYNQRYKFLSDAKGGSKMPPPLETEEDKIRDIMGPHVIVVQTAADLLNASRPILIRSGTIKLQLSLREAYAAMAIRFGLPTDFLKNAMTPLDLEMRAQHHKIKMENETNVQNSALRSLYMDEKEERELYEASAHFGLDTLEGIQRHVDFYAFAVSSWIEPIDRGETKLFLRFDDGVNDDEYEAWDKMDVTTGPPITMYGLPQ